MNHNGLFDLKKILKRLFALGVRNLLVEGGDKITKNLIKDKLIYSKGTKRITDKNSDKFTHYLRYKNDSIMISSKTLNIDNPKLNCRLKGYEKFSPKRIILDKNLEIRLNSYIFKSAKKNNTIIFYNLSNDKKIKILKKKE